MATCAPALREAPTDVDLAPLLREVTGGRYDIAVVLTAVAMTSLCEAADHLGVLQNLREALGRMMLACRGPKPLLVLRRLGACPEIVTTPPHTSTELIEALTAAPCWRTSSPHVSRSRSDGKTCSVWRSSRSGWCSCCSSSRRVTRRSCQPLARRASIGTRSRTQMRCGSARSTASPLVVTSD
ncbi:MAG: hypothetical protein FJW27_04040 [Acidimicrobiia bacterium]|nr:hypothetical protein [Acidimicrobiia bacterium]